MDMRERREISDSEIWTKKYEMEKPLCIRKNMTQKRENMGGNGADMA